jgi:hypothetical protein
MGNAQPSIRRLQPYRCTRADTRVRRALKVERGSACEACGHAAPLEQLSVHHILETRIHPEFAREPLNMLVLCSRCHSSVTTSERFAASLVMHFYSSLPAAVRERHLPFVSCYASETLCSAFRSGDSYFWSDRAVDDLTR